MSEMSKSKGDWQWLRDAFKISDLAEILGVKRQIIDNWIRGRNDPDFLSTLKLATLVGSLEELERRTKVKIELGPLGDFEPYPPPHISEDRSYGYLISVSEHLKYTSRFEDLYAQTSAALENSARKDKVLTARLWFNKGYAQLMLGLPLDAVESASKARKLLPTKEDSMLLADTHWLAGESLRTVGKLNEAYPHLEAARKIYMRLGAKPSYPEPGPIWLEWDLGRYFAAYGKYDRALDHFKHMEKMARDIWLAEAEVIAVWSRADIAEMKSEFNKAVMNYHQAKRLAELIGDNFWKAMAIWRTAEVYRKLGRFEEAFATAEAVRQSFETIGNRRMAAKADCVLAACYLQTGLLDKASDLYNRSIDIFSKAEDAPMERSVLIGLGFIDLAHESRRPKPKYRKPLQAFLEIDANYPNINDPYLNVYKDLAFAEALRLAGYTERALTHFDTALKISSSFGAQLEKAHALLGTAATKIMKGEADRESCIEAFKLYRKVGSIWGQGQALIIQALIERDLNGGGANLLHEADVIMGENSLLAKRQLMKSLKKEKHVLLFIQAV
jgi:tetratricopeptide (TPR) repeat protein